MALDPKTDAQISALAPVQSVAARTGAVTLSTSDISGLGTAALQPSSAFDASGAAVAAVATHEADTTAVHGITDTSTLYRSGGTDVAVVDGGTGSSTASGARSNLGLEIGTDVLAPSGSGASLTALNATQLTTGTLPADRLLSGSYAAPLLAVLSADDSWAGSSGVYSTILTLTIPSTGRWHIRYRLICNSTLNTTFTARITEGTCVFSNANNAVVGVNAGSGTPASAVVTTGSPDIVAGTGRTSNLWAAVEGDVILDISTAGTLLLQRTFATSTAAQLVKSGGFFEAHSQT